MKKDENDIFRFDKEPELPDEPFSIAKFIAEIIYNIKNLFIKK